MISFFIGSNGLFDFDLTFATEAFLFGLLSIIVNFLFLSPLSQEILERAAFLKVFEYKTIFLVNLGDEIFFKSLELLFNEEKELTRKTKILKEYTTNKFDLTLSLIQNENLEILKEIKKDLVIQSAYVFSCAVKEIHSITKNFFEKKFQL